MKLNSLQKNSPEKSFNKSQESPTKLKHNTKNQSVKNTNNISHRSSFSIFTISDGLKLLKIDEKINNKTRFPSRPINKNEKNKK